jgi:hypothetical protein
LLLHVLENLEAGTAVSKEVGEGVETLLLNSAVDLFIREEADLRVFGFHVLDDAWAGLYGSHPSLLSLVSSKQVPL